MRIATVVAPALCLALAASVSARPGAISLGTNLIKPALGLPNLELEVGLDHRLSLALFGEALFYRTPLSPPAGLHPDAVLRLGPRYYAYSFQPELANAGFYAGLSLGAAWHLAQANPAPLSLGVELGYKHLFFGHLYIQPRALLTHAVNTPTVTPGLELLAGASW